MKNSFEVSIIIVSLNAEHYIENAIRSVMLQFLNKDLFEIIIVDGGSEDRTIELSKLILEKAEINYQIIFNEKKILASGWNIGIMASKGNYIIRIDAHSELEQNYINTGIQKINQNSILAGVGGVINTNSKTYIGKRMAVVLSSKIAVGSSLFRIGVKKDTFTDTAVYAVYKKQVFKKIGYFDEALIRNQDLDFHKRLNKSGYLLMTSPSMKAKYFNRGSVMKFIKQAFYNGYWVLYSKGYYPRHLAPFVFTSLMIIFILLNKDIFLIFMSIYFFTVFVAFLKFKILNSIFETLLTFILHVSYGVGSINGLINRFFNFKL
jgi:glycosyltransferase involved in cell wall biosynthesis